MLYSRAGSYPPGQAMLYAEDFSPNLPQGACPQCHGLGRVYEVTEALMVPDPSLTIRQRVVPEKGRTLLRSWVWRTKALSGSLSNWCMLAGSTGWNDLDFANHTEVSHRQKRSTVFLTGDRVCSRLGLLRAAIGLSRRRIQWGTYELSKLLTQFFN
mgnify:CR=1 FL=1